MTKKDTGNGKTHGVNGYDPSHFIVPGQDHHGHRVREWFNVPPSLDHEMNAIVQGKNFPFRTKGDIMRWAVMKGVKELNNMKPSPNSMLQGCEVIIEISRASELLLKFKSSIEALEHSVKGFLEAGQDQEAYKLLSRVKSEVLRMDEPIWKDSYLKEFDKRFGHLWERAKKKAVRLGAHSGDEL